MSKYVFPDNFVWGTATSSYQIEGAATEDGRGESIWDRFSKTPGKVNDGTNGDVACDHYHRYRDDIALMKDLGVRAYRFSVAWPRVLPKGRGEVNAAGLDFYDRIVDTLLAAGIEPFVTLYHWDLPQALQDEGGWTNRATAEAFVTYADVLSRRLGDRVKKWITHNEPWCASLLSHQIGLHAPGIRDYRAALSVSHHLLLSHGLAVPVLRKNSPGAEVGITLNLTPTVPASRSAADLDAARHHDGYFNRWFLDPLFGRHYPADMVADYIKAGHLPPEGFTDVRPGDLEIIATPCDFLGVNYYNRTVMRSDKVPEEQNLPRTEHLAPREEWTEMGWEVYPDGLRQILTRVHLEYGPAKLYVTENGASYSDAPDAEGRVRDERRTRFLRDHFIAARRAIDAGAPLAGYFVWSLLDNFEWERGYTQRFGIVWVDYETQKRIPKDSALWYRRVIAANGVED
ncbi:GH1 family beta-glucosidase [Polyangium sp. y55x31]|uniref:GH1 family beta-glucosidase n=1 Tax=Polyangium sp. y55x31 TaxID=3042688 RepID=UPI002483233D|nr:GH1 family beta-glucosidase [Polyangium sp. y55x31]MDI1475602.1 GH1 family beta-glucosidase [Polyangium sp. y55x31]